MWWRTNHSNPSSRGCSPRLENNFPIYKTQFLQSKFQWLPSSCMVDISVEHPKYVLWQTPPPEKLKHLKRLLSPQNHELHQQPSPTQVQRSLSTHRARSWCCHSIVEYNTWSSRFLWLPLVQLFEGWIFNEYITQPEPGKFEPPIPYWQTLESIWRRNTPRVACRSLWNLRIFTSRLRIRLRKADLCIWKANWWVSF